MLLALPAGAWADLVDRRRLLLGAQLAMFLAAAALASATFLDAASPTVILTLTFALGCGNAVASPAWQAIQPNLVERGLLPQAAALNGLNMNIARAIGAGHRHLISWPRPRRGMGVRPQRPVVRRDRRGGRQLARAGASRLGASRAAGRGVASGRAVRPACVDRAAAAAPRGAVHPGRKRGLGAASGRRGVQPRSRVGRLRAVARHGRDRGRGGRGE